ncbi:TetR/AcrR family transcriptional regulator [Shimia sp. R9_1]|uniref:TetR/AcrR family transcriptional regulator n=1 Tax=Shimia sp. R9_1 TaxID=2821111 RepID=UPI0032AF426D
MKRTEKKRKGIIDAAIDEFREQGFLGAKTTSIARKAQVSSRTFYNHFESKEALWRYITVITDETAIGLNRMVLSELIQDFDRSRSFFSESETHDYPVTLLISEAWTRARFARRIRHSRPTNCLLWSKTSISGLSSFLVKTQRKKKYATTVLRCSCRITKQAAERRKSKVHLFA